MAEEGAWNHHLSARRCPGDKRHDYDLLVPGSAAFAAAITATDAGARVALLEANAIGGTCVNVGCVPSKAMLALADLLWRAGHPAFPGITASAGGAHLGALVDAKADRSCCIRLRRRPDPRDHPVRYRVDPKNISSR